MLTGDAPSISGDYIVLDSGGGGEAFFPVSVRSSDSFVARFWFYTGIAENGQDGMCVSVGGNDLAGRGVSTDPLPSLVRCLWFMGLL